MSRTAQRPELVLKYFVKLPIPPNYRPWWIGCGIAAGSALIGVLLLLLAAGSAAGKITAYGVILLLGGLGGMGYSGYWMFTAWSEYRHGMRLATPRATDAQMDDWLRAAVDQAANNVGPRRLNITDDELSGGQGESILPFVGLPTDVDQHPYFWAVGNDGEVRCSAYKILVAYLVDWRIATFECILDMFTGAFITDLAKEYNLQQVDGIETSSNRIAVVGTAAQDPLADEPMLAAPTHDSITHVTSAQVLGLVVSGRTAVDLLMQFDIDGTVYQVGLDDSPVDLFIARLRNHLRRHMGGGYQVAPPPLSIPGLSVPPGLPRQQGPRTIETILQDLPPNTWAGTATAGILLTSSNQEYPLQLVANTDSDLLLTSLGLTGESAHHVEVHAAALMRRLHLGSAALVINGVPCQGPAGCESVLPRLLPSGAQLTVHGPDFVETYVGA